MKPHPSIFEAALRKAGVTPDESVMVGDSLAHDIAGARRIGMRGVLVARSRVPDALPDDVFVIRTPRELPPLLGISGVVRDAGLKTWPTDRLRLGEQVRRRGLGGQEEIHGAVAAAEVGDEDFPRVAIRQRSARSGASAIISVNPVGISTSTRRASRPRLGLSGFELSDRPSCDGFTIGARATDASRPTRPDPDAARRAGAQVPFGHEPVGRCARMQRATGRPVDVLLLFDHDPELGEVEVCVERLQRVGRPLDQVHAQCERRFSLRELESARGRWTAPTRPRRACGTTASGGRP